MAKCLATVVGRLFAAVVLFLAAPAWAQNVVLSVPGEPDVNFPVGANCQSAGVALQDALRAAASITDPTLTATVRVPAGEYCIETADTEGDGSAFKAIRNERTVVVQGPANNPRSCVIRRSGTPLFRFFFVTGNSRLTVQDLTFTNGGAQDGGAIRGNFAQQLTITRCRFICNAALRGGAVSCSESPFGDNAVPAGTPASVLGVYVVDSEFLCNRAGNVGGAIDMDRTQLRLEGGVVIANNTVAASQQQGQGGGLYYSKGSYSNLRLEITTALGNDTPRPLFYNNAAIDGGGAFISGGLNITTQADASPGSDSDPANVPIVADFVRNSASRNGGAMFIGGDGGSNMRFDLCRIGVSSTELTQILTGLQARQIDVTACNSPVVGVTCLTTIPTAPAHTGNQAGQRGGGVFNDRSTTYFKRCRFDENRAFGVRQITCDKTDPTGDFGGTGGGMYIRGGGNAGRVTVTECCFTNNQVPSGAGDAGGYGGGLCAVEQCIPVVEDSVFKGNQAAYGGGMALGCFADAFVYNTVLTHNVGTQEAGGIWIRRPTFNPQLPPVPGVIPPPLSSADAQFFGRAPRIMHCTITANLAGGGTLGSAGTGIHIDTNEGAPAILNTIVYGNRGNGGALFGSSFSFGFAAPATPATAGFPQTLFSIIDTGDNSAFPTPAGFPAAPASTQYGLTANSNFDSDPRFVNLNALDFNRANVHLTCPSPAIDRASFVAAQSLVRAVGNNPVRPLLFFGFIPPAVSDPTFEPNLATVVTNLRNDYDDQAGDATTNPGNPNANGAGPIPKGDEPCPAPNCDTQPYTGGEPVQPRTCRATQCQSDIGADESRTAYQVTPLPDKVVCINGRQSFTVDPTCAFPSSLCDPGVGPPLFTIQWCLVRFNGTPAPGQCVETPLVNGNGITISPDQRTITIDLNQRTDDLNFNGYIRAKISRGGPGVQLALPAGQPCDPAFGCPPACVQGRLYVVPPPTVATTGDRTVCRNGSQCLQYSISWTELSKDPLGIECPCPGDLNPTPRVAPDSCIPAITYTYQRVPGGPVTTFTGNPRAAITCEPDTFVADPTAPGALRKTRICRICFTDALDGSGGGDCDAGRYCARISCGLETGKCADAEACANLCVIPTPIPGGDLRNVVCIGGQQTINLFGEFPNPSACALPWCPTSPCIPTVIIGRRPAPNAPITNLFTYTSGQTTTTVTIGGVIVTCSPISPSRRVNCTVRVNPASLADCGEYTITTDCSNLLPDDKCQARTYFSPLCVLPRINGVGDPTKNVCIGGRQTACLYLEYPQPECVYCLPPYFNSTDTIACVPTSPPVFRRIAPNGTELIIPLNALGDGTGRFRGSRTDAPVGGSGQGTSTTTVTCEPFNPTTRRVNCCVEVTNANDANCARYRITGNCSNLPATDKCEGTAETQICVARPPTVTVAPDQFVCIAGTQFFDLSATFPTQPCIHCGPLAPRAMVLFRPTGGAEQMFPCVAQPDGTCIGTIGRASIVCQPFNTTTRTINCRVTVTDADAASCGEYCIKADYVGVDSDKCAPVIGCTRLCVVLPPVPTGDPDKTVCFGKSQTLNFKATFPRGQCLVSTGCPTACTPAAAMFKRDALGNVTPLTSGSGTTVTCDPVTTLPNGDREINCRVVVTNAAAEDCLEYIIRASCANLNDAKCRAREYATKLCVIRNPIVTIDPQRYVCVGGNQQISATVNFPAQDCFYCPTNACVGTYEFVRRPNTSCASPSTGGVVLPIVPVGQAPPASGPYVTCVPSTDGRTQNCTIFIRNAMDAGSAAPDCGAYYVRAKACPNLPTDKCDYVEACGQLCVIPAPDSTGDSAKCVCVNGRQVFNFRGFFPTPACVACPTTPAACTPFAKLVRKLPGNVVQDLYVSSGTQPAAQPRVTATCSPLTAVAGGREFLCTVTITNAQLGDCGEYCLQTSCSNLESGKCATDEYCANLCVLPSPATGGDTSKTVCVKGTQFIDLYAEFPQGSCALCTLPGVDCCTPAWTIKRRSTSGSEVTLNIGGSRTDSQTYPGLPGPPDGAETVVATTSVTCEPIGPGPQRRVNCRVTITNANDATCGEYCIEARCSNYPASGAGSDKCVPSTHCARLCVLRPPSVTTPAEVCVCVGGCQTIPFTVNFPAPACNVTGCDATTCQRVINVYKLDPNGNRLCALTAGPGVDQYVCDPAVGGVQNCRIRVGGGNCSPAAGCPGASLSEDNNQYCIEVTCGGLAEGKCLTDRGCTRLRVYEPPCPTDIDDVKICQQAEICVNFDFTAPPCCQSAIAITKDGQPLTLSTNGRYRLITLGEGRRRFCITAPSGQFLNDSDDGVYRVTISCPNLTAEKNCSCYKEFCVDVLSPPTVTVTPPVQTVCEGQDADYYICPSGDLMRCPIDGGPSPMPVPLTVMVQKVSARPTGNSCDLPPGETASDVWTNVTVSPAPTPECPARYRVHMEDVVDENCGFYRVKVTYAVSGAGFDPDNRCVTCTYFELRCGTVNVCLKITPVCEDEPLKICPRFAACDPNPYEIPGGINCADYPCFDFKWYFTPSSPPGAPEVLLTGETSCCIMIPSAGPEHEGCYRLVVTPNNTRAGCENQPPCDPVEVRDCFRLRPPEECCWCVDCCWDNGRRDNSDNADGVLSMKPGHDEFPEIKAAADFYLCEGQFHRIKKFAGSMLIRQNPILPYKAKLTLYEDCDGCPGAMINMWDLTEYCLVETPDSTGLQKIDFVREFTEEDKLWLRGGKSYWWSLQGISDLQTINYEAYWVTSQLGHIVGSVPKKMENGVDAEWIPLGDCCIDCTELAFCIECDACKIIYDGGTPEPCATAGGSRSEKSASPTRNSRAADNFVTPPVIKMPNPDIDNCDFLAVDWMVCYVEGYIYTNCVPGNFRAYLEIYSNDCNEPSWTLAGEPPYRFRADKIDPVEPECLATIDGVSGLRLYKVRFCPMGSPTYPMGLYLRGGRNVWASISVEDGFAQNQRAYFAWNSNDCDECPIQFGPGKEIAPGRNIIRWTEVGHDFAFLVAAKNVPFDSSIVNVPVVTPDDTCPPDTNADGNVTVQDLFNFLNAWFVGCP